MRFLVLVTKRGFCHLEHPDTRHGTSDKPQLAAQMSYKYHVRGVALNKRPHGVL